MENQFGRTSRCDLVASSDGEKTVLSNVAFTAPFKIMTPFYEKPDVMHVMLLSASAGIMEGDTQEFQIRAESGAHMRFSAQAYEKIHKMKEGFARRTAHILVKKNANLEYDAPPVIPFAQSAYTSSMEAELEDESSLFTYQEILSCGRTAYGECFQYRSYHNLVTVKRKGKRIYRDNCYFEPEKMELEGLGMYEGFHHYGTLLFFNREVEKQEIEEIRQILDDNPQIEGGVSRITDRDLAIRVLGNRTQKLEETFDTIKNRIEKTGIVK